MSLAHSKRVSSWLAVHHAAFRLSMSRLRVIINLSFDNKNIMYGQADLY